jgi:hypothetical protein
LRRLRDIATSKPPLANVRHRIAGGSASCIVRTADGRVMAPRCGSSLVTHLSGLRNT